MHFVLLYNKRPPFKAHGSRDDPYLILEDMVLGSDKQAGKEETSGL